MGNTNTLGFGSLASVAWTDMNGTGLSAAELTSVNADIAKSRLIANALLGALQGAVNKDWTSFNLGELFDPPDPATAADWATDIGAFTGKSVSPSQNLSLSQWRGIAAELQDHEALQASKRSTSGQGGGVKNVNGHWYVNGQQLSLLDVYMAVRVNQVANFDDSLNIYISELNDNNKLVKACNDWLNTLRSGKPEKTDIDGTISAAQGTAFSAKWGYDPLSTFMPQYGSALPLTGKQLTWDKWIETTKSYVDAKDTENQTVQQKLEQMTNRRSEVLEGLTSFAKSQSQTGSSFARNLG